MGGRVLIFIIGIYRRFLSPLKNILTMGHGVCRYRPTCSAYGQEAIRVHGLLRGSGLLLKRLLRCHPWGGFGWDPVPDSKSSMDMNVSDEDSRWMAEAIAEARKGLGRTAPNPAVGATVVRNGILLGRGYHEMAGLPHAEPEAIRNAKESGHDTAGATLYVTLEPCSTSGRTPPCTEAIKSAGIKRVVIGCLDPNPAHHGLARSILEKAGIEVTNGVLELECRNLNPEFNARFSAE